jgi:fructose-1,6-bisphosphatase/inositol monophosphatase family enzyme
MASTLDKAVSERLELAVAIAQEAGQLTLRYFRRDDLQVERKADKSPVTIADRGAEELLRKRISERFSQDAIVGEEFGASDGKSGYTWALDPIDGTKSFVHGVPLYTTLVAVLRDDKPCVGVIHAPAAAEIVYAQTGGGCWYIGENGAQPRPARVSKVARLSESLLLTTEVRTFTEDARLSNAGTKRAAHANLGRWIRLPDGRHRPGRSDDRSGIGYLGSGRTDAGD